MARIGLSSCPRGLASLLFLGLLLVASPAQAKDVELDFSVGWVTANPDGAFDRPTIGVNGQWPPPLITATVGDHLRLNLHNHLRNESTSLHFHGFFQNGTNHMDGAVGVTQCAIPPGGSLTYEFDFQQPGTYWYHAHNEGQYPEGLRGPIVVHDPQGPYEGKYDEEVVLTLSDWYHRPIRELIRELINVENPTGAEPVPQAALINDTQNLRVPVVPEKTYLVRIVNIGAFAAHFFWIEGHEMTVVEVDGVWTDEALADRLYVTPAQRYSVLVKTRTDKGANFPIVSVMDQELFDVIPDGLDSNVTGWLVYDAQKPLPAATKVQELDFFDDFDLVPVDRLPAFEHVDHSIQMDVSMDNLGDGANYAFFNDVTYVVPKVPSLYSALTLGDDEAADPRPYGSYTSAHVLAHNQVIEIVLNNLDDGRHPFHLHGHNFQLVHRSEADAGTYVESPKDALTVPKSPMRRDTVTVEPNGNIVLRFRSDNPGVWLFHCHIEWHMDQGLVATMIEAPDALRKGGLLKDRIPDDHLLACQARGTPTSGNAAGNKDALDLRGQNAPPPPLPEGFTAKGYAAIFFSGVSAVLGMGVLCWYGSIELGLKSEDVEQRPLLRPHID